jgi:integrase
MAALDRGMNLKLLSSALGHVDESFTVDTYLHIMDKEIIQGYRNLVAIGGADGYQDVVWHRGIG